MQASRGAPGLRWFAPLVAVSAAGVGIYLRAAHVGAAIPWGDEFHSLALWGRGLGEVVSSYDATGSGLALPLLQRLLRQLVGPTLWAVRGPALLGGVGALLLAYPVARPVAGRSAAALLVVALALNPVHVFYSYYGRAYGLVVLLALVLVQVSRRAVEARDARVSRAVPIAVCAGLLPWVHLTAAGTVVAVAGAAVAAAAWRRRLRSALPPLAAGYGGAAVLCLLLHLPAWESFSHFVSAKAGEGAVVAFDVVHVADLLAGGRAAGLACLGLLPVAALWALVAHRDRALWVVVPALGPVAVLAVVDPLSDPYSYARYLLGALPFLLLLLAWGFSEGVRRLVPGPGLAAPLALLAGSALLAAGFARTPFDLARPAARRYGAIYLAMRTLPRFDVPSEAMPALYRELAAGGPVRRIIEVPPPPGVWGLILYRNYFLRHGRDTWLGSLGWPPAGLRIEPFARLATREQVCAADGELLVVHRDLGAEARRYREGIFAGDWRERIPDADRPFVEAFLWTAPDPSVDTRHLARRLRRELGEPIYEDADLEAWELDAAGCGGRR